MRESQTGLRRTELFCSQLCSEKGRESLVELRTAPPRGTLAVCAAVHCLLSASAKKIHWQAAERMLEDVEKFLAELQAWRHVAISARTRGDLRILAPNALCKEA